MKNNLLLLIVDYSNPYTNKRGTTEGRPKRRNEKQKTNMKMSFKFVIFFPLLQSRSSVIQNQKNELWVLKKLSKISPFWLGWSEVTTGPKIEEVTRRSVCQPLDLGRVHVQTSCVKPRFWNLGKIYSTNWMMQLKLTFILTITSDEILKHLRFYVEELSTIFFFLKT